MVGAGSGRGTTTRGPAPVRPGAVRRRLTVAFVLVAGISAAVLAGTSYALVRQARLDGSLQRAAADARYQLVLAQQFTPLTAERRSSLLTSFEGTGRHVVLITGDDRAASNPAVDPPLGQRMRDAVAAGQLGWQRSDPGADPHLLVVGARVPGATAELYLVTVEDDLHDDLDLLRTALLAGWAAVVALAAAVGHLLARRTLEPVGRASRAAHALAEGLLDTRLPVAGRDEFSEWAAAFNSMAGALEAKIDALARAQARERRFTADVAHELRTPITGLAAAASLLREELDRLPADARRPAELIVTDIARLRRLLEDLMEISRLDAGREVVRPARVDTTAVLRAVIDARGWTDRIPVSGEPAWTRTDPRRLERVLTNLLGNAVEHGRQPVTADVSRCADRITIRVRDRGPGIAAEHLPYLFDRFYKADPSRSGRGSGLGLSIARHNALLLGGRITVASEIGVGTEFRVELPADDGTEVDDDGE